MFRKVKRGKTMTESDYLMTYDILDSLGEGVFTVDKDFKINFFNRTAETITGLRREEVIGKFCKNVFQSSLCLNACPIAKVLESGNSLYNVDSKIAHVNGNKIPIRLSAAIFRQNHSSEPAGGVISFLDLSEIEMLKNRLDQKKLFHGISGQSKPMNEIFQLIEEISESDASVLIQGESGTGKELVANAIQATSRRKNNAYLKINCSVFPSQLLATELFGHVRGAFTGAVKDRKGRFEMADNGTIFLDEIAEMSPQTQLQLLRILQEGTFERIGESVTRKVDVRIIAATNRNLQEALSKGDFREDLYYRLNVVPIEIPPLRERPVDIPLLFDHFLKKFAYYSKKNIQQIDDPAMDILLRYSWPGNVRELENALEYAIARTRGTTITANALPPKIRQNSNGPEKVAAAANLAPSPLKGSDDLVHLLEKHKWNKTKVANELGIGRTTLWRWLKKYGLEG